MTFTTRTRVAVLALLAALSPLWGLPSLAQEVESRVLVLGAPGALEQGQGAWGVRLGEQRSVMLYDRVLVEDDGPGVGSDAPWMKTDRAPTTEIAGNTRIKKVLHVERLGAKEARLCVPPDVAVEINGRLLEVVRKTEFPQVPVSWLKQGDNEVVLYCPAGSRSSIKIALPEDILRNAPEREDRPPRSFKSTDGGKTWQPIRGEYMVRLHLVQYVPQGHFVSPVMDLGGEWSPSHPARPFSLHPDRPAGRPMVRPVSIESFTLSPDASVPEGTHVDLSIRTGPGPVYEEALWSAWSTAASYKWLAIPQGHRYWQWKAVLSSGDPAKTPRMWYVSAVAKVRRQAPAWAQRLRVVAAQNEEIRYTSLPFEYEDPLHPRMVALRRKYKLDEVVSGAKTEMEKFVKLRDWVAHQWKYLPPDTDYPAWDADEILTRKCGFCVQYAIVLMQSAISLGHQARFVFGHNPGAFDGGGHEVCEIWSNEHRKWVFFDVNGNWHYVDRDTNVPMSMLEVHDLLLKTYGGGRATLERPPLARLPSDVLGICYGTSLVPGAPPADQKSHIADGRYTVPTRWLFVNYMPRNNFYAKPYPQPKTQGCHWDWSDYWCWEDAQTPRRWQYRNFTARRSDLAWTINQVCFDATIGEKPGALSVQLGTCTPYFDTFLANTDRSGWKACPRSFAWELHAGRNRLEMRVRNTSGIEGPVSFLEVDYAADHR